MALTRATFCVSQQVRRLSQSAYERLHPITKEQLIWKTEESDPRNHTEAHEGLHYLLPSNEQQLQKIYGFSSPYDLETTKFYQGIGCLPLMIRHPALDAIGYIKRCKPGHDNVRFLLYGDRGRGKTHSLVHIIHYLYTCQNHFIINIRNTENFTVSPAGHNDSTTRPGQVDTPMNAAMLLQQMKITNAPLFEKHADTLRCSEDYSWSSREITKTGEPLLSVIDHGVNRINHASDCAAVMFKELTRLADEGKIDLALLIDDVRPLFLRVAGNLKHPDNKKVLVDEITVAIGLKKMIQGTHKNVLVVGTCDNQELDNQNQTPQDAIGPEGWRYFDPFIPIAVPNYSRKEFESCMNMYQDLGWLCRRESHTREARDEIRFMSGLNPGQVCYLSQDI